MSGEAKDVTADAWDRRERPSLFPWNRKLRHLQGVSIRNLNVVSPGSQSRGKHTTDDEMTYSINSPSKRLAQKKSSTLTQSRSFTNLKSSNKEHSGSLSKASVSYDKAVDTSGRPGMGKLRRRSTLHWSGPSPRMREQKLQDLVAGRMADTWFSIHHKGMREPVYVSEVMDKCMNPTFRFFDLSTSGPSVIRTDEFTLRVWAKTDKMDEYSMLIDLELNLQSLQFVGKSLENFHHPLPQNCVLFHLTDGIYTSFTDMPVEDHGHNLDSMRTSNSRHVENTSSYDALMRLIDLDDCIQDALFTREKLERQINTLLDRNKISMDAVNHQNEAKEKLDAVERAISTERKQLRQTLRRKLELEKNLKLRGEAMESGYQAETVGQSQLSIARQNNKELESLIEKRSEESKGQIRRICDELTFIYPIEPLRNKPLHFVIRGLYLPNSVFDDTNRDEIAAALGFTSQLTYMLSLYLSIPLPYPILSNASNSFIEDPISVALAQRIFPLHPINVSYKFEYGVFLLNKDIEFLMNQNGLRLLDIRHTLPNLKYLLYVLTAGKGELPARKAGGVRALIPGRATPSSSRRGSDASVSSNSGNFARSALPGQALNATTSMQMKGKEKAHNGVLADVSHDLPIGKLFSHRSSSLREAY